MRILSDVWAILERHRTKPLIVGEALGFAQNMCITDDNKVRGSTIARLQPTVVSHIFGGLRVLVDVDVYVKSGPSKCVLRCGVFRMCEQEALLMRMPSILAAMQAHLDDLPVLRCGLGFLQNMSCKVCCVPELETTRQECSMVAGSPSLHLWCVVDTSR
jgi:hypothetical protein